MNSRDTPILLSKNLTTPLSVNVDNQIVPQCANTDIVSLPDHLSPDTRKHLIGPFTGGGDDGGGTTPIISPTMSAMASFDSFDYDGSAANLLQIGPDLLLGGLLDRNMVWFNASNDDSTRRIRSWILSTHARSFRRFVFLSPLYNISLQFIFLSLC